MLRTICLLLVLCSATFTFAQEKSAQRSPKKKAAPTIDSIDAAMQRFVKDGKISGAVTLIGHEGKVVHLGAVGLANIESKKAMKRSSLFSIASMTKPVVATAVLMLQDEGKLSVDDKVSKYIPAFAEVKLQSGESVTREITIRDILTHTSGLAGEQIFTGSLAASVDALAEQPLAFEPGSRWQYSPGLNVAGRIVEIVSQQPLQDFLQNRIFDPLEMKQTTFFPNNQQQTQIATLYGPDADKPSLVAAENRITKGTAVDVANPSGGLFSTARDMYNFYQMVLNGGQFRGTRLLSAAAVEQMATLQTAELETGFTPGNGWGLGWCIVRQPQGVTGMLSPGTFGHGGAFGTQGWIDPQTKTIYVLMIQRTEMGNSDASEIRKVFQQVAHDALEL